MGRTGFLILVVVAMAAGIVVGALLLPMVKAGTTSSTKVCVYSNSAAIARSKAAQSVAARLKQLTRQARAHEKNKNGQELNARLDYTRATVMHRISSQVVTPLVKKAYQDNHCAVLLKADAILQANRNIDLTPVITRALDKKITKVRFDLLHIPDQKSNRKSSHRKTEEG